MSCVCRFPFHFLCLNFFFLARRWGTRTRQWSPETLETVPSDESGFVDRCRRACVKCFLFSFFFFVAVEREARGTTFESSAEEPRTVLDLGCSEKQAAGDRGFCFDSERRARVCQGGRSRRVVNLRVAEHAPQTETQKKEAKRIFCGEDKNQNREEQLITSRLRRLE